MRRLVSTLLVATFLLLVHPVFAAAPLAGVITPGQGIGPIVLGMSDANVTATLGKPDFQKDNDDGTTLYEWGLLTQGDLPDATLWLLIDGANGVAKVGTDGGPYQTFEGLGVGDQATTFVNQYGFPAENPAPGFFVFRQGIGIAVNGNGVVHTLWIEKAPSVP